MYTIFGLYEPYLLRAFKKKASICGFIFVSFHFIDKIAARSKICVIICYLIALLTAKKKLSKNAPTAKT